MDSPYMTYFGNYCQHIMDDNCDNLLQNYILHNVRATSLEGIDVHTFLTVQNSFIIHNIEHRDRYYILLISF